LHGWAYVVGLRSLRYILACCQVHRYNGGVSHNPDVRWIRDVTK